MSKSDAWRAMRMIVAQRDGASCVYCRVPTAATIEHLLARNNFGVNDVANLRIACPSCNSRKSDMAEDKWRAIKGWELPTPDDLPPTVTKLLAEHYKLAKLPQSGFVYTGSVHSRLQLVDGVVFLHVRAAKEDPWRKIRLGREDHPKVVFASFDFLRRHNTSTGIRPKTNPYKKKY